MTEVSPLAKAAEIEMEKKAAMLRIGVDGPSPEMGCARWMLINAAPDPHLDSTERVHEPPMEDVKKQSTMRGSVPLASRSSRLS